MTAAERKKEYHALCDQGKITSLFMQPWWLDAAGPWDVSLAIRNGQIVGAMPFALRKKWGFNTIGMPPETHHLRIWMDRPPDISAHKWLTREKQIIWLLVDALPPCMYFSLVFEADSFNNWLPFHWKGFHQEMRYTFVIDRKSYLQDGHQVSRNVRRNIREAEGEMTIQTAVDLSAFYTVCQHTYQRQQMKISYSYAWLERLDQVVSRQQAGVRLGAYDNNNTLVAVAWLLWDQRKAYYFIAGDTDAGRQSGASLLLYQEALKRAFEERQVETFDFCGSMLEPITDIRRQFGATAQGLMKIWKSNSKLLDVILALRR